MINKTINRVRCGRQAEERARHFLEMQGLIFIASNYRAPGGEIDLIMRDGATLVFIEVRLRCSSQFGDAVDSITNRKQARITATAADYLQRHHELANYPCRFDVVAFTSAHEPRWLKAAFGV